MCIGVKSILSLTNERNRIQSCTTRIISMNNKRHKYILIVTTRAMCIRILSDRNFTRFEYALKTKYFLNLLNIAEFLTF